MPDQPVINGFSSFYDVFKVHDGRHVRVLLRQHPDRPCEGYVRWTGMHLVQLEDRGELSYLSLADIIAVRLTPEREATAEDTAF